MTAVLEQSNRISITILDGDLRLIDSKRYTVTYQMFSMATEQDFGQARYCSEWLHFLLADQRRPIP